MALAKSLVEAGTARTVLLVTTPHEIYQPSRSPLLTLFGDGAAAL